MIVALQGSAIAAQGAVIAGLESALVANHESRNAQRSIIATQGERITVLEQQLTAAPKPSRLELRLFG